MGAYLVPADDSLDHFDGCLSYHILLMSVQSARGECDAVFGAPRSERFTHELVVCVNGSQPYTVGFASDVSYPELDLVEKSETGFIPSRPG